MKNNIFARLVFAAVILFAQTSRAAEAPAASPPVNPDHTIVDSKADPCDNFFRYACGKWLDETAIPADKPLWDRSFMSISENNQKLLKKVLEDYAAGKSEPANPYARQLGELYGSCMNEDGLDKGSTPALNEILVRIDKTKKEDFPALFAFLKLHGIGPMFGFSSSQDFKHPKDVIGELGQGGMGLPSRDYYLDQGKASIELRKKYSEFIVRLLRLIDIDKSKAKEGAEKILAIETQLATAAMAPVEMRDPKSVYHMMTVEELGELSPGLDWPKFFAESGVHIKKVNVTALKFFKAFGDVVSDTPIEDLRTYMKFHAINASSRGLSDKFYDETFGFFGKTLYGVKEKSPRWKRCVDDTNAMLGFALGRSFVSLTFAGPSKDMARTIIENVEKLQGEVIDKLPWMDAATKKAARAKLHKLVNQIGYPDKWRNYDGVKVSKDSYLANRYELNSFNTRFDLAKIGKPLDRGDWGMPPSAVNAYYDPQMNKMVFPAGILQPPFFSQNYPPSANYAAIGMVMGHEISHGYDDEGRQFDGLGAMQDWWSKTSSAQFDKQAACLGKQYDAFSTVGGGHVNGKLTMGENIGDQGGMKTAYHAWKKTLPKTLLNDTEALRKLEQDFFLSFAQVWCSKSSDEFEKVQVNVNPHPPARYRVTGALMNLPEFAAAYQCKAGTKMAPAERCVVW